MAPSVHRLHLGTVTLSAQFNPLTNVDARIEVYAYLIVAESHILLVDTGVGEGNAYIDQTFEPRRAAVAQELARFGVSTSDVSVLINSHLHFDHCGNNRSFPEAEVLVQAEELSIARTTRYTVNDWFDYDGARINAVSGDLEITRGIRLLSTPGHTPGHQSVCVDTDGGTILIAAQAAFTAHEYERGGDPATQAHEGMEAAYVDSIVRLKSIPASEVYFSHDDRGLSSDSY